MPKQTVNSKIRKNLLEILVDKEASFEERLKAAELLVSFTLPPKNKNQKPKKKSHSGLD